MPAKKTVEVVTEEKTVELVTEEEEKKEEIPQTPAVPVNETTESECFGAESTLDTTKNNTSLPLSFKVYDLSEKTRQIFNKLVSRTKKPKKEALEVINSIPNDIIREVEGVELEIEEKKEKILEKEEKEEEKTESDEKVTDKEKQEEILTRVLDKSND